MYRFGSMDLNEDDHLEQIVEGVKAGDLIGITDEKDGGIIAYAVGQEHADLIVTALQKLHKDKRTAFPD